METYHILASAQNAVIMLLETCNEIEFSSNLNSHALLDMISDESVVVDQPLPSAHVTMAAVGDISIDEAFDHW